MTQVGARCSVLFGNRFYDNVKCARKGVTSLAWPKPKIKINFHNNNVRTCSLYKCAEHLGTGTC